MSDQHNKSSIEEEEFFGEGSSGSSSGSYSLPETHLVSEENHKNNSFREETKQLTPRSCSCYYILAILLISMVYISLDNVGDRILVARSHRSGVGQFLRGTLSNNDDGNTTTTITTTALPFPFDEHWSHATNSIAKLSKAMENPYITALEVDVRMGHSTLSSSSSKTAHGDGATTTKDPTFRIPILSHESRHSDLSVQHLMDVIAPVQEEEEEAGKKDGEQRPATTRRRLMKHVKFDLKEFSAVEPVIKLLQSLDMDQNDNMIYLNADILPFESSKFNADDFLSTCLNLLANASSTEYDNDDTQANAATHKTNKNLSVAFSIGYVTIVRSLLGFREDDLMQMSTLIKQNHVMDHSAGVVLPINARVLSRNMLPFDLFLDEFPTSQLLVWTGHGEPPISKSILHQIQNHFFRKEGRQDRIGFDVQVASNVITGTIYDCLVDLIFYLIRLGG